MNDSARQKLVGLVAAQGKSIIENPRRAEGLFRDHFGAYRREISVLKMALEEHVGLDLLAATPQTPRAVLLSRLSRRLCDNLALSEEAAEWAVNSWALALGVISEADLKTIEQQSLSQTSAASPPASQNKTAQTTSAVSSGAVAATTQQKSPPVRSSTSTEIIVSADGSGDYVSINEAIRAARNGSRISVQPGLYAESLKIDKQIEIAGEGAARNIIVRSPDASCVLMQTERAIIRNLTLQCAAGQAGKDVFGVDVSRGELTLQNCDVSSDSLACIGVRGQSTNALIRDCLIHDGADSGIYFFDSAGGTIEQCEIYRNKRAGVVIAQNANPTFKNCRVFSGENVGFFVYENGLGTIDDCDIFGHQDAEIAVTRGGSPVLRGCSIHNSNNSGVFVRDSGRALIEDCSIYENAAAGVAVDGASMVAVTASRINNNGKVAFRVKGGSIVRVENSDLRGNLLATWDTDAGVQIEKYGNQEY